jgi:2-keto-4-pentenoate hydratase
MMPHSVEGSAMRCRHLSFVVAASLSSLLLAGCATPRGAEQSARQADVPTCPDAAAINAKAQRYVGLAVEPTADPGLTMAGAKCGAAKFMQALGPTHGPVVGYKAGLTNPAVQQRFNLTAPLRGTLLANMLLPDGATVPAKFGVKPFFEADLIVEVGSTAIHTATTPLQALAALRSVRPFIELPDTLVDDPSKLTAPALVLNNVGARLGVLGAPVAVRADAAFADALRDMTVQRLDASGKVLQQEKGTAILGHPLNAVIWLAAELKRDGITLKPGDLLSLGAFFAGPVQPGVPVRLAYLGLPGDPKVSVNPR